MQLTPASLFLILAVFSLVLVCGFLLWQEGADRTARRYLVGFLAATALTLLNFLYMSSAWVLDHPSLAFLGNTIGLLAAPLLYLYAAALAQQLDQCVLCKLVHFLPVLVFLLVVLAEFTLQPFDIQRQVLSGQDPSNILNSWYFPAAIFVYVLSYLAATMHTLWRHKQAFRQHYATMGRGELNWLRTSIIGATVLWLLSLMHQVLVSMLPTPGLDQALRLAMAFGGFMLGLYFLTHALRQSSAAPITLPTLSDGKYGIERLSDQDLASNVQKLETYLQDTAAHLQPSVSLSALCNDLPITPRDLSQTINRHYGQSFFDFINTRRIDHAKDMLRAQSHSITDIMYACGFASKSSFYAAFKKSTGTTPSKFIALNQDN